MAQYKRVCNFCLKDFIAQKFNTKYCCNRCASLGYKMKMRQEKETMFNDNETFKRLLNRILLSIERMEQALDVTTVKQQVATEDLISPDKYCEQTGIHRKTLTRMMQRNEVKYMKQGNKIFIYRTQISSNNKK